VERRGNQALRETLATLKRLCEIMQTWQQPSSSYQILIMLTPFIILLLKHCPKQKRTKAIASLAQSIHLQTEILPNFTKQF